MTTTYAPGTTTTTTVKPSQGRFQAPTTSEPCPRVIWTTALDNLGGPVHISNHRFFDLKAGVSFDDVVEDLKTSLAGTLELFPPVAGTVRYRRDGDFEDNVNADVERDSELVIDCDGAGVPFTVERIVDEEVKCELELGGDARRASPRPEVILDTPAPALAVKVTEYACCGKIAVATSMHHTVTDLTGFVLFLETWSAISRGLSPYPSLPTKWTRSDLQDYFSPPAPSNNTALDMQSEVTPEGYTVHDAPPTFTPHFLPVAWQGSTWSISFESLRRLKADLTAALPSSSNPDKSGWISSSDALSALLWGALTRARAAAGVPRSDPSAASATESLAMAVDGRRRSVGGRLARSTEDGGYFGNVNLLVVIPALRADLLLLHDDEGKPGGELEDAREAVAATARVALAIRTSLSAQLAPSPLAARIRFFLTPTHAQRMVTWSADAITTNWSHFDLAGPSMGFSALGAPVRTTAGPGPCPPGFFRVMRVSKKDDSREEGEGGEDSQGGSLNVLMWVEEIAQDALRSDRMLGRYVEFVRDEVV